MIPAEAPPGPVGYDLPVRRGAGHRSKGGKVGKTIELHSGEFRARIGLVGAALQALTWQGRDVVWPYTDAPIAFQGQVLAPWPNRLSGGRYRFEGTEHRLPVDEPATGSAIHGLVHDRVWTPEEVSGDTAVLRLDFEGVPGYPFPLALTVSYRLDGDGLTVTTLARNTGGSPAPFGLGFHPYLAFGEPLGELAERGELLLEVPASLRQPVDDRLLPSGDPVPVEGEYDFRSPGRRPGGTVLDTAFTGLERDGDGRAWVRVSCPDRRVSLWCDNSFGWLQLFSADTLGGEARRAHLAVEPMTCPPDALSTGTDLIVLAPGSSTRHTFGITAEPTRPEPK